MNLNSFRSYVSISLLLLVLTHLSFRWAGFPLFSEGPPLQIALSAKEVWETGRFDSERLYQLKDTFQSVSAKQQSRIWQDIFAIQADGRVIPKHCPLLILMLAPLYGIFGEWGIILASFLMSLAILIALFKIVEQTNKTCPGLILLVLIFGFTQFPLYTDGIELDLFGAFCVVVGLALAFRFPVIGSWLVGMSIFVRPTFLPFLPLILLPVLVKRRSWSELRSLLIGLSSAVLLFLLQNWMLWGHPFLFVYHRFPGFLYGEMRFLGHSMDFSLEMFGTDWFRKLFDPEIGLIRFNPIIIIWVILAPFIKKSDLTPLMVSALIYTALLSLLIFAYSGWEASPAGGNRYLLSAVLLLTSALCPILGRMIHVKIKDLG